jgi:2-(3-amino-3-carboxypropyl)histidine synthase
MRILLQFPEGLKQKALEYAKRYEKAGDEVFISASPTFGACDLAIDEAKNIKADKIVHFGHGEFHKADFNVEYVPYEMTASLEILKETLPMLVRYRKIGIVTTIQHVHQLGEVRKFYEANGKEVVIGKPYGFAKEPGQILGCDIGSAATIDRQVEAFVYFGGGVFHPLGAVLATTKPFVVAEPFNHKVELMDRYRESTRKQSRGKIMGALEAKSFAIMVSTKNGQHNMALGQLLREKIRRSGLAAEIIVANSFDFESLDNMREFDAFVNTACPRIAVDDPKRIRKPLLSANELMEVLKLKAEIKS